MLVMWLMMQTNVFATLELCRDDITITKIFEATTPMTPSPVSRHALPKRPYGSSVSFRTYYVFMFLTCSLTSNQASLQTVKAIKKASNFPMRKYAVRA
jgi:hypothetical protein